MQQYIIMFYFIHTHNPCERKDEFWKAFGNVGMPQMFFYGEISTLCAYFISYISSWILEENSACEETAESRKECTYWCNETKMKSSIEESRVNIHYLSSDKNRLYISIYSQCQYSVYSQSDMILHLLGYWSWKCLQTTISTVSEEWLGT